MDVSELRMNRNVPPFFQLLFIFPFSDNIEMVNRNSVVDATSKIDASKFASFTVLRQILYNIYGCEWKAADNFL